MDNLLTFLGITYLLGILVWVLSIYYKQRKRKRMFYLYWYEDKPIANAAFIDHGEVLVEGEDQEDAKENFLSKNPDAKVSSIVEVL